MDKFSLRLLITSSTIFLGNICFGQYSLNAAGGNGTGNGGSVAYSIGQMVFTSQKSSSGSVDQGVQHVYTIESLASNGIDKSKSHFLVFPNPVVDILVLKNDKNDHAIKYQFLDTSGKSLLYGNSNSKETRINMSSIPTGTYIMIISSDQNQTLETFKIIKK